jgi:hypothetical protein
LSILGYYPDIHLIGRRRINIKNPASNPSIALIVGSLQVTSSRTYSNSSADAKEQT